MLDQEMFKDPLDRRKSLRLSVTERACQGCQLLPWCGGESADISPVSVIDGLSDVMRPAVPSRECLEVFVPFVEGRPTFQHATSFVS